MAVKAPTPPTPPTPPSMDGKNFTPESQVESSGLPVPAGELHTPAERFGIHIKIGGSEASTKKSSNEAEPAQEAEPIGMTVEQKIKADAKAEQKQQMAVKKEEQPSAGDEKESGLSEQEQIPLFGDTNENDDRQTQVGDIKAVPNDEGFFNIGDGGSISYWPFLIVFAVAFTSFILMSFMKKRQADDDFGSFQYKKKQTVQEYAKVQQETKKEVSVTSVKAVKPVSQKKKRDEQSHFEIRI